MWNYLLTKPADKVLQQLKSEYCCPQGRAPLPDVCLMGWISDEMKRYAKERTRKAQRDAYGASAKGKSEEAAYQGSGKGKKRRVEYENEEERKAAKKLKAQEKAANKEAQKTREGKWISTVERAVVLSSCPLFFTILPIYLLTLVGSSKL